MKLNSNEVEAGHCLICRMPATLINGEWFCDQHSSVTACPFCGKPAILEADGVWQHLPLCEWCGERHLPDTCELEPPIDADDFDTGGYGGMYQR